MRLIKEFGAIFALIGWIFSPRLKVEQLLVVSGIHPSVSAAYKALERELGVSRPGLYGKLNRMELDISQALVRYSASNLESLIDELKVNQTQLLAGYEIKIADGNHLSGTEHRLKVLRGNLAKALPGKLIAALDPQKMLVTDIILNQSESSFRQYLKDEDSRVS